MANILRGKNKPVYTPHLDAGDFVVVINAEKVLCHREKRDGQKVHDLFRLERREEVRPRWRIFAPGIPRI